MARHMLYYNLCDAFAERGCPICRLGIQAVDRYLDHLLYESVNDPGIREEVRQSWGFCREHAHQLEQLHDALGIAIIYQDVISHILRAVGTGQPRGSRTLLARGLGMPLKPAHQLAEQLRPAGICPACRKRAEVEGVYLDTLLQHAADPELLALWRASDGLCWPHFQQALRLVRDETALRLLMEVEMAHFQRLRDQLDDFIRRHDYRWGSKGFVEGDSWRQAVAKVSGDACRP